MMNPRTGEILASAVYPTFDPNNYGAYSLETRRNVVITDQYEPGSTFKFVTAAAAVELGLTWEEREFYLGPIGRSMADVYATGTAEAMAI